MRKATTHHTYSTDDTDIALQDQGVADVSIPAAWEQCAGESTAAAGGSVPFHLQPPEESEGQAHPQQQQQEKNSHDQHHLQQPHTQQAHPHNDPLPRRSCSIAAVEELNSGTSSQQDQQQCAEEGSQEQHSACTMFQSAASSVAMPVGVGSPHPSPHSNISSSRQSYSSLTPHNSDRCQSPPDHATAANDSAHTEVQQLSSQHHSALPSSLLKSGSSPALYVREDSRDSGGEISVGTAVECIREEGAEGEEESDNDDREELEIQGPRQVRFDD